MPAVLLRVYNAGSTMEGVQCQEYYGEYNAGCTMHDSLVMLSACVLMVIGLTYSVGNGFYLFRYVPDVVVEVSFYMHHILLQRCVQSLLHAVSS